MTETPDEAKHWDSLPHRKATDAEVEAKIEDIPDGDPMHIALAFMFGLSEMNTALLETVTNPESRESWGDYTDSHQILEDLGEWGVGSEWQRVTEAGVEIAYVKILREIDENMVVTEDTPVMAAAILSLVHRPEFGDRWFVQAIGDYWHPSSD